MFSQAYGKQKIALLLLLDLISRVYTWLKLVHAHHSADMRGKLV